ncbi:MAG: hypothetical protein AMJ69_10970 [Gammaproteobacteria bacterium SG8_47]|nr:MAG: hypothetical protein AMJ69_10970 [Gammaproteobacteria bacterium SG8_47]
MSLAFERTAVVGATGPTGRELTRQLVARGSTVRVVSRRLEALEALFPEPGVEKRAGDALDSSSVAQAIDGCDLVLDCIGLPPERMADHPRVAATLAGAIKRTGARCLQVSSYWSFIPVAELPVREDSPRAGGPPWVQCRREAEDILVEAGAAVVHLPDFFGPGVHTSTLQLPLKDAAAGKPMNWIGGADIERDYVFVPDAMGSVCDLIGHGAAYGERWLIPGSGPISAHEIARLVSTILGRPIKVRAAGPLLLRLVSVFQADLRGFMQLVPTYVQPIRYDTGKLETLLGPAQRTPYEQALRQTLDALTARA